MCTDFLDRFVLRIVLNILTSGACAGLISDCESSEYVIELREEFLEPPATHHLFDLWYHQQGSISCGRGTCACSAHVFTFVRSSIVFIIVEVESARQRPSHVSVHISVTASAAASAAGVRVAICFDRTFS